MASIRRRRRLSKAPRREQRRRQTRTTRAVRRQLRRMHDQLPRPARALFDTRGGAFRRATALRCFLLRAAALGTVGRHTVAHRLRTLGPLVPGDASS